MKIELDILPIVSDELKTVDSEQRDLHCPVCGCINSHIEPPYLIMDGDWKGNGPLAITPIWSECGSKWRVCIGEHKGSAPIFVQIVKSCKDS